MSQEGSPVVHYPEIPPARKVQQAGKKRHIFATGAGETKKAR